MKKFYFIIAAIAVIGMLFVGCPNETSELENTGTTNTTIDNEKSLDFGILVTLPGKSRAVTYYTEDEVSKYIITVSLDNQTVKTVNGQPGETVKVRLIDEGTYVVAINAYNEDNTLIGEGFGQKTIAKEDGFVSVTIHIDPKIKSVGTDLSIDIIWNDPTDPSSDPSINPNNPTVPFYTVVFYDNGGSGSMDNMICEINKEYTLPECGFFAPYGKKFNGWNVGDVGAKFSNLSSIDKDIIVIVPEWIEINEYNVIYHNVEDASSDNPKIFNNTDSKILLNDASKKDWYFCGWYDNSECVGSEITELNIHDRSSDIELWAKWSDVLFISVKGFAFQQSQDNTQDTLPAMETTDGIHYSVTLQTISKRPSISDIKFITNIGRWFIPQGLGLETTVYLESGDEVIYECIPQLEEGYGLAYIGGSYFLKEEIVIGSDITITFNVETMKASFVYTGNGRMTDKNYIDDLSPLFFSSCGEFSLELNNDLSNGINYVYTGQFVFDASKNEVLNRHHDDGDWSPMDSLSEIFFGIQSNIVTMKTSLPSISIDENAIFEESEFYILSNLIDGKTYNVKLTATAANDKLIWDESTFSILIEECE